MSKFTDAIVTALKLYFEDGDYPTEAQFAELIDDIQAGIEEHDHQGAGDGDAAAIDQSGLSLTSAGTASGKAVRYNEFSADHAAADGSHDFAAPPDFQEETADPAAPSSGWRRVFARDSKGLFTEDAAGNVYALAFAGGAVAMQLDEPRPASWQHKDAATGSSYGDLRIEWGRDTLSTGTKAITFQQAFSALLEVFLIDKTAANAMYPSSLGTTGFTANGTGSDTFGWLAVGYDGR